MPDVIALGAARADAELGERRSDAGGEDDARAGGGGAGAENGSRTSNARRNTIPLVNRVSGTELGPGRGNCIRVVPRRSIRE